MNTAADALLGVGHILAEDFAERADLRERLRKILRRTGKLVSTRIETEEKPKAPEATIPPNAAHAAADAPTADAPSTTPLAETVPEPASAIEAFHPITSEAGELEKRPTAHSNADANGSTGDVGATEEESHSSTVEEESHDEVIEEESAVDEQNESAEDVTTEFGIETTPLADGIPPGEEASPVEQARRRLMRARLPQNRRSSNRRRVSRKSQRYRGRKR